MVDYTKFRGPWYPDMPPKPDGLTENEWAADLMDPGGKVRSPFDHVRSLKCAIGFHTECAGTCACPHHTEPAITPYDAVDVSAVRRFSRMRHVPINTARRILAHAQRAAESGEATTLNEMREVLQDVYGGSPIGDSFMLDVLSLLDYGKIRSKKGIK